MLVEHFLRTDSADRSESDAGTYRVYSGRWVALALFCTLEMANALMWVSYAPISDISQHYFGSGWYGSITAINMLANIFLIVYPFGTIAAVYTVKYFRPRNALIFAGALTSLGSFLRLLAAIFKDDLGNGATYGLMFLGQALGAFAQPYFTNFAPALSGIWFAADERDISTSVGAMCSPLGNAFGQLIPPFIVSQSQDENGTYHVDGMKNLMFVEVLLTLIPLFFAFFFLRDGPPTPPSHSTKLKQSGQPSAISSNLHSLKQTIANVDNDDHWDQENLVQKSSSKDFTHSQSAITIRFSQHTNNNSNNPSSAQKASSGNVNHGQSNRSHVWEEVQALFRNKDFVLLAIAFCIGVGFFNSIMTLLNQIVGPYGYSNDDAGTFGAVFIVCGLIGAGVMGKVLETTKAYLTALRVGIVLAISANVLCFCLMYSHNFTVLVFAFGVLGACVLPLLPAMLENCAECTYPIPEEVSAGILYSGSNLSALGFIFALQYLLEENSFGPPPLLPSTFFIFGILIVAGIIISFYRGEYKRHNNEMAHAQEQRDRNGDDNDDDYDDDDDNENRGYSQDDLQRQQQQQQQQHLYHPSDHNNNNNKNSNATNQNNHHNLGGKKNSSNNNNGAKNSAKRGKKAAKYVPPAVAPGVGEQHQTTDMNLVRVASTDGASSNARFSTATATGSSAMWTMSRDIPASPSQSHGNSSNLGGINNPIQQLVTAVAAQQQQQQQQQHEEHPSFRSNGSGL